MRGLVVLVRSPSCALPRACLPRVLFISVFFLSSPRATPPPPLPLLPSPECRSAAFLFLFLVLFFTFFSYRGLLLRRHLTAPVLSHLCVSPSLSLSPFSDGAPCISILLFSLLRRLVFFLLFFLLFSDPSGRPRRLTVAREFTFYVFLGAASLEAGVHLRKRIWPP